MFPKRPDIKQVTYLRISVNGHGQVPCCCQAYPGLLTGKGAARGRQPTGMERFVKLDSRGTAYVQMSRHGPGGEEL